MRTLACDPVQAMTRIGTSWLLGYLPRTQAHLRHSISRCRTQDSGSPMRLMTGTMELKTDDEWTRATSAHDQRDVTRRTRTLLARYGYDVSE